MFNSHFYHATVRKTVAVFGTLFNNITVARLNSEGRVVDSQKVPLSYGPKQKFLSRIEEMPNLDDPKSGIKLPRMSFEITSLAYDGTASKDSSKVPRVHNELVSSGPKSSVPWTLSFQLSIMAKNQDEGLQILEQILPTFGPSYTVTVKYVEGLKGVNVPITLQSVNINDSYEGDYSTERVLVYTLDFTTRIRFYSEITDRGRINNVICSVFNLEDESHLVTQSITPYEEGTDKITLGENEALLDYYNIDRSVILRLKVLSAADSVVINGNTFVGSDSLHEGRITEVYKNSIGTNFEYTIKSELNSGLFTLGENIILTNGTVLGELKGISYV